MKLKTGGRYRSQVCDTEVVAVRAPADDVELTCGGQPMIDIAEQPTAGLAIDPELAGGNQLGKRLTDDGGTVEVLVTKAGNGTLALGRIALQPKEAQALPSSD